MKRVGAGWTLGAIFGTISLGNSLSSCRKAEPEELVNAPSPTTTAGGMPSDVPDPSAGGTPTTEPETGGDGAASGAGGRSASSPDASVGDDGGPTTPEPTPGCTVPEIATDVPFSKQSLLEQAGQCAMGRYCVFSTKANVLRDAVSTYADGSGSARATVQTAWKAAMDSWQEAEQFRFGPAANSTSPGGQDLRDIVYSWPLAARCKVDEQTLSRFYAKADFAGTPAQSLVSGRSLAALEYLLYYEKPDNGCNAFSVVNAAGGWATLSAGDIAKRRRDYSRAIADDVATHAERLLAAWSESGGNFKAIFASPGSGNATYATEQAALNSLNEALFYIENDVKDVKLAIPLGISPDCLAARCPDAAESPYAKVSSTNLRRNLEGFRKLFQGCGANNAGLGFDDWLESVGRKDLADVILSALGAAEAAVQAIDVPVSDGVVSDPAKLEAAYAAIKAVTDPLKGEMISVLNLELPSATEGDND